MCETQGEWTPDDGSHENVKVVCDDECCVRVCEDCGCKLAKV